MSLRKSEISSAQYLLGAISMAPFSQVMEMAYVTPDQHEALQRTEQT